MKVYLSSTLDDLRDERQAVKDVLSGECIVKESYFASEQELQQRCLDDVAECDLYVGVIGLRYGYRPPDGAGKSITQMEYEEAGRRGLPRLVFIKDPVAVAATSTDEDWRNPASGIALLRQRIGLDVSPALFKSAVDLKLAVQKAYSNFRLGRSGGASLMSSRQVHPWEFQWSIAFGCVPGTDDGLRDALTAVTAGDRRFDAFSLSPAEPNQYLAQLDRRARRARVIVLTVTAASWPRWLEQQATIRAALAACAPRTRLFLLAVGIGEAELGPDVVALFAGVSCVAADAFAPATRTASFDDLRRWLRARVPETVPQHEVGIPCVAVALTLAEAQVLDSDDSLFDAFGDAADLRRAAFKDLRQRYPATWTADFYGSTRDAWRPFGAKLPNLRNLVEGVFQASNEAVEGSRERRGLRDLSLLSQWYRFEELLDDRAGSKANLESVCRTGCLVLMDEFVLLHPGLRDAVEGLVASDNVAVIVLSGSDPSRRPLGELLGDLSHLNLGNLRNRFRTAQDPCCELAVNNVTRMQRWLRLVLPEVLATLGQQQSNPTLVQRVDALFDT